MCVLTVHPRVLRDRSHSCRLVAERDFEGLAATEWDFVTRNVATPAVATRNPPSGNNVIGKLAWLTLCVNTLADVSTTVLEITFAENVAIGSGNISVVDEITAGNPTMLIDVTAGNVSIGTAGA